MCVPSPISIHRRNGAVFSPAEEVAHRIEPNVNVPFPMEEQYGHAPVPVFL